MIDDTAVSQRLGSSCLAQTLAKSRKASSCYPTSPSIGLQVGDSQVVQEPTKRPYGGRRCALHAPAGSMVRIQEVRRD